MLLSLLFLITIVPFNKFIIIAILIVIMPYFYLLMCHKPIRDILQGRRFLLDSIVAHLLCLNVIRDVIQLPWVYSIALVHIPWVLKWSGIRWNAFGKLRITSLHISCVLRWSRINLSLYGLWATASLHISWVLRLSGVYAKRPEFASTASLHSSCVFMRSGTTIIKRE